MAENQQKRLSQASRATLSNNEIADLRASVMRRSFLLYAVADEVAIPEGVLEGLLRDTVLLTGMN